MGLYIPNMEMPKGKPICVVIDAAGQARRYDLINGKYADDELFKADSVPPHGDLIDRVAFREEMDKHYPFDRHTQSKHRWEDAVKSTVIKMLATAPTIIPAEEV